MKYRFHKAASGTVHGTAQTDGEAGDQRLPHFPLRLFFSISLPEWLAGLWATWGLGWVAGKQGDGGEGDGGGNAPRPQSTGA